MLLRCAVKWSDLTVGDALCIALLKVLWRFICHLSVPDMVHDMPR